MTNGAIEKLKYDVAKLMDKFSYIHKSDDEDETNNLISAKNVKAFGALGNSLILC